MDKVIKPNSSTKTYLRSRGPTIEKGWRSMSEPTLRHHVVCFDNRINIILVNSNSNSHQHMLRPFYNLPLNFQKVGPLKGFEAEIIIVKISIIYDLAVQTSRILKEREKDITWERLLQENYET